MRTQKFAGAAAILFCSAWISTGCVQKEPGVEDVVNADVAAQMAAASAEGEKRAAAETAAETAEGPEATQQGSADVSQIVPELPDDAAAEAQKEVAIDAAAASATMNEPGAESAVTENAGDPYAAQDAAAQPPPAAVVLRAAKPGPSPAAAKVSSSRVVRYVKTNGAAIYASEGDSAASVGRLAQGDVVMVIEDNGWGRISGERFVKLSDLSAKAVVRPRTATAEWQAP